MNKLLAMHRKILAFVLLFEISALVAVFVVSHFNPEFNYYYQITIALCCLFIVSDFILSLVFNLYFKKHKGEAELKAASVIGNDINEAYNFGELGLAVCNHDNIVMWVNDFLGGRFPDLVDQNIYAYFYQLQSLTDPQHTIQGIHPRIVKENRTYDVELIKEARLFIFRDVSDFANIYTYNQNQAPVVGYIAIDNYSDIQMYIGDDTKFNDMQNGVNDMITKFAEESNALLRKIKEDRYLFITTKENYEKIYADKFSLVSNVNKRYPRGFTLSIGIALGFPDYAKLASMASSALDVALSRGGDQTVVDDHGQPLAYFGGKTDHMPSRNRVKTRTLSNSFMTILKDYKNVVIMGHRTADFDAIGASLAVYVLAKSVGVPARICWEEQLVEDKCRRAIECEYSKEEMDEIFVSMKDVNSLIHNETLLVLVDHSNPRISIFPESYVEKFDHVAVIDHHQPANFVVNGPVFENIDTTASSASEILTSFILYNPNDIYVDERTATFLLAGICLDTHFYREHASNSTFEVSSQLKNWDADSIKVVDFLKEDLEEYRQKISILDSCETPYTGVYVAVSPDQEIVSDITLSRVADEAISVRGIQVSFCIGRINPHTIKVSARSDGTVNCAIIMQKMGGGGRFVMAAATFNDTTVEDVKTRLLAVLNDYLEDARMTDHTK